MIQNKNQIEKNPIDEIHRRISNIETHIINMIVPLQNLSQYADPKFIRTLNEISSKPLMIDDSGLKQVLNSFTELMQKFSKGTWAVDPDKVYEILQRNQNIIISLNALNDRILRKLNELEKVVNKQRVFINVSGFSCENNSEQIFTKEQEEFLESDVRDAEISVRLNNLLLKEKMKTWKQVLTYGKVKFYKIEKFGKKAILEMEEIFKKYDIEF